MKFVHVLFLACMFTSSFEIILNLNLGGVLHFAQFGVMILILLAIMQMAWTGVVLWSPGSSALTLWAASQVVLMPVAGLPLYALEFTAQMLLSIGIYYAIPQFYGFSRYFDSLMRWYLYSFLAIAAFGLLQFATPLLGLPGILVTQWISHGRLARINGFNYEPSYFATYMLLGWVLLLDLRSTGARVVADRRWKYATIAVTAVLLFSTSRTAIAMVALEVGFRIAGKAWQKLQPPIYYWLRGRLVLPQISFQATSRLLLVVLAVLGSVAFLIHKVSDPTIFLQGTGLGSTAAHSVTTRNMQFERTFEVIRQHPFFGRGLAGVPADIAANEGAQVTRFDDLRIHQGFPAFVSIYAASGLFAFIPFAVFLWQTSMGAVLKSRPLLQTEHGCWMHAMGRASLLVYFALMVDQNFFRIYVWIHLAVFSIVAFRVQHPLRGREPIQPDRRFGEVVAANSLA